MDQAERDSGAIVVCRLAEIPDGGALRVARETTGTDDDIAVFNDGGRIYALNDTCTHARASLADGWVEDGEVECPMHSGRFDLLSGEAVAPPATRDTVAYGVEVRDGAVWLHAAAIPGR